MTVNVNQQPNFARSVAINVGSIDPFFDRTYSKSYNCLDFVREVWEALTGEQLAESLACLLREVSGTGRPNGRFRRLESPVSPCIVLMQRRGFNPHVGIYLDRRVLHLHTSGVEFQPLIVARTYFTKVSYYQ